MGGDRLLTHVGLALGLCGALGLGGCYSDQKKQLAGCEAGATRQGEGQPLHSILACMDMAGYRFVARDVTNGETVVCDIAAVIEGKPSADGTDAMCFEPKGTWAMKIYRMEVPVATVPVSEPDTNN